ncbi:MAG: hypothetical protein HY791_18125 [Deltaproteobacteria bacterium]|nr:hypothetical protein [Deltaproteobacteria bacterium]
MKDLPDPRKTRRPRKDSVAQRTEATERVRVTSSPKSKKAPTEGEPFEDDEATELLSSEHLKIEKHTHPPLSTSQPGFVEVRRGNPEKAKLETTQRVIRSPKGVKPRGAMALKGTKAAGAMAHKLHVDRMVDENMPATKVPALRLIAPHLARSTLGAIEETLLGHLESRREGDAAISPKRNLERLIHDAEFAALEPRAQAALLSTLAEDPADADAVKAIVKLVGSGVLSRVPGSERRLLLELLGALAPRNRRLLASIAERPLRRRTALEDHDVEDGSLVAALHSYLLGTELDPRIERAGLDRETATVLVLSTLAHPERLPFEDGPAGVLGIIEYALAEGSPAEWLRLWARLSSGELVADLPGRGSLDLGDRLATLGTPTFKDTETPLRQGLEIVAGLAHPRSGPTREAFAMPGGHGIDADIVARSLGLIYGIDYSVFAGARAARRALESASPNPQRVPPAFISVLFEGGERLFIFDHLADRLYLRAPHGTSTKPRGAVRLDPSRVVEDPSRGLESISNEELDQVAGVAITPRS